MEELIAKSLTENLTEAEKEQVNQMLNSDESFRQSYGRSLEALALADFVVGEDMTTVEVEHMLAEMTSH